MVPVTVFRLLSLPETPGYPDRPALPLPASPSVTVPEPRQLSLEPVEPRLQQGCLRDEFGHTEPVGPWEPGRTESTARTPLG